MASTTESSTNALTTSTNAKTEDENEWVLPVWRSSTVLEGKADLTDVSFYPYGNKGEDPVFAVAGIGLIVVYRCMRENSEKDKVILLYEYRDKDDFKYVNNDDPQKEAKTSPNLGEKDEHQRSRAIAWACRDDYLPLLCVTGPGDIQPPKQPNPDSNVPKTFPPIAINTLIRVINPYTGERIQTLLGHGKTINALATSPTIPYILASASDDKTFFLWSLAQKHTKAPCIAVIGGWGHIDRVLSLAWHPNGEWLLSGGFDNRVCLWNVSQSELDLPAYNQPCGEWVAKQVLMPYFVSSEVHRHPVERVAWKDDTIISHGMAERYVTQWKITGFSSRTPTEMLPAKPSFQDEDARTRSAWDLTDRDKVQNPLYRRLLRFGVPEKKDEMLDDPWCEKRGFVDFDIYAPTKMRESEAGGKGSHTHATLAVCKGMEVRFWDFKRLLAWQRQSKKLKQGEILELRWQEMESGNAKDEPGKTEVLAEEETAKVSREETPPTQLARIDPDDSNSEVMLSIRQEVSARKARFAEKARKEAEAASANLTPTKAKPPMSKKTAVRKTAPSTGGVPSEPAGSPAKSESVGSSAMFRRESMVAKRKCEERERAEKKRLSSNKAVPDVSDGPHINGQKEAAATADDEADAILSFQLAQRPRPRKVRQSLTFKERVELKRGKENKCGDDVDKDQDGDNAMGLDGVRSSWPAKMVSRKTAPSTGGLRPGYGPGLDGGGDERPSSRQYGSMSLQSIHASRVAREYEPGGLGGDAQSAEGTEDRQRGPALTAMAHNAYAVQSNPALPSSAANDEPPRRHGMMSLASIQASRTARVYSTVVPNRAVAAPSRRVPARKPAPSTGGVVSQEPLPINGADINVTIISDDEEKVDDEDPMALRDAEAALYAEPPVKRKSKKEIEAAEFAEIGKKSDQEHHEIEIGLRPWWVSMRYDKDDNELEHIKQSVIAAQHQEEIDAINAEKAHWKKVRENRAAVAARAKEIRKRRVRPRTQQGLGKITGDPVHSDAMDISSDEEDVKHIPGYTKSRLADIWQIGNYPPNFERMGKRRGRIMEKTYNDTSPILVVRTNEKGMVDDNGDLYAYAYDIGKRVRKLEEDSLFEVPLPRKRYKLFPIADLPAWQRFSFSPIFGCWIAPPRPEHNEPSPQVRQRVDSEGHMDSEGAHFIKTRHRQRVYKVALQLKREGEDMESDSEPEAPRPRYPPHLMMYGRTGEDLIKYMDSLENGELVNDKPAESSAPATAAPAPAPVPSQPRRPLPFAAQKEIDQYESDGDSISTSILPSSGQRGRKRPLEDEPWNTHVCPHCDRRFGRAEHLKRHYTTVHKQLKDFECQKCGKKFNGKDKRDEHARTCNGGWIVEGFGFLARQNERLDSDVEESEPIRSPVARLRRAMGFGMDGAGSGDDRGRATLRSGALSDDDDRSASMQESSSSRPPLLSSGLRGGRRVAPAEDDGSKPYVCEHCNDRFSRREHLNRHERTIHSQDKLFKCQKCSRPFNRDDNLRQHMRVHGNGNHESGAEEERSQDDVPSDKPTDPAPVKSKPLSGYNAMLQRTREAQLRKRSLTDSLGDSDISVTAKSKKPALRELRQDGSTQLLRTPPRRTSARQSLAREDSAAGGDTTEIGMMVQNSHPVNRAISGLSTREGSASTDSSRKSSRVKRQTSRRSELEIDMLDTAAVKAAKKVRCDSCGGALTGRGRGRYSFQVAGETEDDPPREFCAPCHKRDFGDGKEKEKEKPKDRRTSITFGCDGAQVCCLCNSKSSPVWNQRLHHEEGFGDGKFCCKPCYDSRYREKMNPGSTTGPKSRGRKRARELSPYTGPSDQVPEDITGSDADKAMKEVGLNSPDLPASSPVKSSSPSKDKGNAKEEPSKEKLRPEGWEKYHMGDAWRPLDAHHVDSVSVERVQAEMAEDRLARCCRWSLDGRLLVVVGDFGLVSVFERP